MFSVRRYQLWLLGLLPGLWFFGGPWSIDRTMPVSVMEQCDNAIDDDNDGLIDLNDPDCDCQIATPNSLIPNPSFEELDCCPDSRSQLDCATGWAQASAPTTDFLHICNWLGWDDFPPALPFPNGQGAMGFRDGRVVTTANPELNWKEYAGACLLSPMLAFNTYRFEFYVGFVDEDKSPPIDITFFGSTDCANLPFGNGDQTFGCPTNGPGWVELGAVNVRGNQFQPWIKTAIELTPDTDITAMVIGAPCALSTSGESTYYFFDELILADIRAFDFVIRPQGNPCQSDFQLSVPDIPGYTYQWYRDGIALIGETDVFLATAGVEGLYQVKIETNNACRLSPVFDYQRPLSSADQEVRICQGDRYDFGSQVLTTAGLYRDTLRSRLGCDSIVTLDLQIEGSQTDTVNVLLFPGERYQIGPFSYQEPGDYLNPLASSLGCDSLVLLQLEYYQIFIPNVFSPNEDGVNDRFEVYGRGDQIAEADIQVFDRWGALVHRGEDWDGRYQNGEAATVGVYLYVANLRLKDGQQQRLSGDITLIR